MSDIDELAVRRFDKMEKPVDCTPLSALEAAKKFIMEQPEGEEIEHVIIFTGRSFKDGASATRFFQAGSYSAHAQAGLIEYGRRMLNDS